MIQRREFLRASAALPLIGLSLTGRARAFDDDPQARSKSTNNLKQIALAFHNYHAANNHFPARAVLGADGKPLLSWRVVILPYLEAGGLHDEFRMDEPWDSDHNKALLAKMPDVYKPVVEKEGRPENVTYYQGFHGPKCVFEDEEGATLQTITDGTSNTLMVVEAEKPVPWTKPADVEVNPDDREKDLPKLGGQFEEGFLAALCDGSVRYLKKDINPDTLRALITRNGGEVINANDF